MNVVKILEENKSNIEEWSKVGLSCQKIGDRLKLNATTVSMFMFENDIRFGYKKEIKYDDIKNNKEKIIELFNDNISCNQISKDLNLCMSSVNRACHTFADRAQLKLP